MYFITDSIGLSIIIALAVLFLIWLLKGTNKQAQQQQTQEVAKEYTFDFDALSSTYKLAVKVTI
ncbi:MAG: hypothetical protein LBG19_04670 [Prevotellaceae bacterium]|jgi:type II secretory pathway pseudopilin PulG|nr:hypothetical protein [Prevotellaceae bacterium]